MGVFEVVALAVIAPLMLVWAAFVAVFWMLSLTRIRG